MITSVRLVNFKNFADETLRVGPFTVIVGANASGKSNIRDAFRFLHGIGRGYTLADIIGGKHGGGGQIEWSGVRGAMNEIIRFGQPSFSLQVEEKEIAYTIEVGRNETKDAAFRVNREKFKTQLGTIFTSTSVGGKPVHTQGDILYLLLRKERDSEEKGNISCVEGRPNQPGLTQIKGQNMSPWVQEYYAERLKKVLANMRFLDLEPHQLRQPAFPGQIVLGDSGENLPTVLRAICEDPQKKETLVEWIRELTPMDVRDFEFPTDPSGRVHLVFLEANDRRVSAYAASDGTLRFLAMLAVLLGPDPNGLYFFEEIDNGIHPARQWLLLELIEKQTAKQGIQVITTTHSPDLLTMMNDETFKNTSVVCRLEDADDAIIRPVAELPRAGELRKSQGLSNLLSGGWMEDALAFTEGYDEKVEN
ncbi:MAG: ATP-binding protein [Caldilineaceae bacterium]|nr:ATP-binding protein [Caldilineaceae bacterium]